MPSPSPASPASMELPEEIATAIDDLVTAAEDMGASYDAKGFPAPEREAIANEYRSALTAAILSRLGAAEAGREEAPDLCQRLRTAADGDLRELARDSLIGIHPDQKELREWADLMDAAANEIERLTKNTGGLPHV